MANEPRCALIADPREALEGLDRGGRLDGLEVAGVPVDVLRVLRRSGDARVLLRIPVPGHHVYRLADELAVVLEAEHQLTADLDPAVTRRGKRLEGQVR